VQQGVKPGEAATLTLLPKVEDAVFFAAALPVAVVWSAGWRLPAVSLGAEVLSTQLLVVLAVAAGLAAAAWLVAARLRAWPRRRPPRFGRLRVRVRRGLREARAVLSRIGRRGKRLFALTLLFTAAHWGARYSVVSVLAAYLGMPFDPVLFWLLQWVVFTLMSFVPTPGAAGGAEAAFAAVYGPLLPGGSIGLVTAAWRLLTFYLPVAVAALAFPLLGRGRAASE
jgi:uncharacterized protein (TIRG00374 family)